MLHLIILYNNYHNYGIPFVELRNKVDIRNKTD